MSIERLQQFKTTFIDLVDQMDTILPEEKSNILKCKFYLIATDAEKILYHFLTTTRQYQNEILSKNDTFIQSIQSEFELLKAYNKRSKTNKDIVLEYLKIIYLYALAYHEGK